MINIQLFSGYKEVFSLIIASQLEINTKILQRTFSKARRIILDVTVAYFLLYILNESRLFMISIKYFSSSLTQRGTMPMTLVFRMIAFRSRLALI